MTNEKNRIRLVKYKIKHFFPYLNKVYLSKIARDKQSLSYNCKNHFNFTEYWSIILALIIFLTLILLKHFNLILTVDINYLDFFKTILIIPLTLIGFIIPITLLVINNLSNKHPLYMNIYLKCCLKPFSTVITIISAFILNLMFYFYVYLYNPLQGNMSRSVVGISQYLILIGFSLILFSSLEALKLIKRTMQSFNNEKLYKSVKKHIFHEIMLDIYKEEDRKIVQGVFRDFCEKNKLKADYLGNGYENKYRPILALTNGFIKDVNIKKLIEFRSLLKKEIMPNILGAVHQVGYFNNGKVLGYVNREEDDYFTLQKLLNDSFIITNEKNKDIKQLLDDLKDSTVKSIEKNEESEFERIINVYMHILEDYMVCMKKNNINFGPNQLKELREPFRSLLLIKHSFKDIVKYASSNYNKNLITIFLFKLSTMSKEAIYNTDYSVIPLILETFVTSYIECAENGNDLGKNGCFLD